MPFLSPELAFHQGSLAKALELGYTSPQIASNWLPYCSNEVDSNLLFVGTVYRQGLGRQDPAKQFPGPFVRETWSRFQQLPQAHEVIRVCKLREKKTDLGTGHSFHFWLLLTHRPW